MVIFDLTFLPGGREFDSNLLENVKIPPYAPPPPPRRLDIDRCIMTIGDVTVSIAIPFFNCAGLEQILIRYKQGRYM